MTQAKIGIIGGSGLYKMDALKDVEEEAHHKDDDIEAVHKYAEVTVREAFDAARRRLQDAARRQRADAPAARPHA